MAPVGDFNLIYSELFKHSHDKRKLDNKPLAAAKSKTLSYGCLKFLDSYKFIAMLIMLVSRVIVLIVF